MLDPDNIANFNATDAELEALILFWVATAASDAHLTARALDRWLAPMVSPQSCPFQQILDAGLRLLPDSLKSAGFRFYNQRAVSFWWLAQHRRGSFLRRCSVEELLECPGINLKTAKGFLMYTRDLESHMVVDRHYLRQMREYGHVHAPKDTPQSLKLYTYWEQIGMAEAKRLGISALEFDRQLWLKWRRPPKAKKTKELAALA